MKIFNKIKCIILLNIFIGSYSNAFAQEGFHIGIQVSPQMSWLMNSDDANNILFGYKNTFNTAFGIVFQYGFTNNMGVGVNTMYSFQGQRYAFEGASYYRKVDYIKIPLLYVFNYEVYPGILFVGKVGPQIDILMNAKLADESGNDIVGNQSGAYENFDVGGTAYGGLAFKFTDAIYADLALRFDYAFTDAESKGYKYNINHPVPINNNGGTTIRNPYRTITNNSTAGINIGIRYVFKK